MNPLLVGGILDIGSKVIDKLFPDPQQKIQAQIELMKLQQEGAFKELDATVEMSKAQAEINKVEAGTDLYRGGWRPGCGWICVLGLFYTFIFQPIAPAIIALTTGKAIELPLIKDEALTTLLYGMLGLAGWRTVERVKDKI